MFRIHQYRNLLRLFLVIVSAQFMFSSCTQDKDDDSQFAIMDGYDIQLVASEPAIKDPVDVEFDRWGRPFVLEMPGYPFEDQESRIILLADHDNDGIYENHIVYADELELASSILPYRNGMLVAAPPYLLHLVDTDGDDIADQRDTLLSGFSTGNLQHNYNGLTYALDGWIYGANGGNNGEPFWWGDPSTAIDLKGGDFRCKLETKELEIVGHSSGGYELAFDEYGKMFETHNTQHIGQLVFPSRYTQDLTLNESNQLANISDHEDNGLARIFPIGEQETRVNHPEQSGYFSGACGITYYGGGSFGSAMANTVWIADVVLNLIHIDKLSENGSVSQASRLIESADFLASRDRSFRPVNLTVGPDGAMYIVDMQREVIEHPEWIPDEIEANLELNKGKDLGRIYKVVRSNSDQNKFDSDLLATTESQIRELNNPNQWVRLTAHRLLNEGALKAEDLALLQRSLSNENNFGTLHSLWVLASHKHLSSDELLNALSHADPGIRENAILIAEAYLQEENIQNKIIDLITDNNQRVRLQASLTSSLIDHDEKYKAIANAAVLENDKWNNLAMTISARTNPIKLFDHLVDHKNDNVDLMSSLLYSNSNSSASIAYFLNRLQSLDVTDQQMASFLVSINPPKTSSFGSQKITNVLTDLERSKSIPILSASAKLRRKLGLPASKYIREYGKEALAYISNNSNPLDSRLENLDLVEIMPFAKKSEVLFSLLSNTEALKMQEAAMNQLWEYDDPTIATHIISNWKSLGPQTRRMASDLLLYKEHNHSALLTALETKDINIGEMNFDLERRRTLLWWTDDEDTKSRAQALFSDAGVVNRKDVIHQMKAALDMEGSTQNGSELFEVLCGQCHLYKNQGNDVGPVLTEINRKSKESLLYEILDPNAAVDTRYINHKVELTNGTIHIGIVESETDKSVILKKLGGSNVNIDKSEIQQFVSLGSSMMPEGLEENLNHQEMADLLAFLQHGM